MEKKDKLLVLQITVLISSIISIAIILLIPSFFIFTWNEILRDLLPNTKYFFRIVTELGGTLCYLWVFFTFFWGINKKIARSLFLVYVSSAFVNHYAKAAIAKERPLESNWLLISASHLSTPSGHAMSSTIFWSYSSMKIKRTIMWLLSIIIILLVGLSRMYLGVHWLGDILTGWLFGITILTFLWIFEDKIRSFVSKYNILYFYLGLAAVGLIVMFLTEFFFYPSYNIGGTGGKMIGLGVGFALELKYINFDVKANNREKWRRILRILIGIIIVSAVLLGLNLVMDNDIFWIDALIYIITLLVGIVIWPYIFKRIRL